MFKDPRIKKLAKILLDYSLKLKKQEKLLITSYSLEGIPLAEELYCQALLKGAYPYLNLKSDNLTYFTFKKSSLRQLRRRPKITLFLASWADKFVNVITEGNPYELANINPQRIVLVNQTLKPVKDMMLKKHWVLTYFPSYSLAQTAQMSLEELEDFYFKACLQDWQKIKKQLKKLKRILDNAREIKVLGKGTKLSLSFKGRRFAIAAGECNMPDGEIFGAPLKRSVEGQIYFDFPSLREGREVKDVFLKFEKGRVTDSKASKNRKFLAKVLKTDQGASFVGELGLGVNYKIKRFMKNTLFDEKIGGTIHLALGSAYPEKQGGGKNRSAIHWDLVKDMRKKGSKIFVNEKLIFKDGKILASE